MLSLVAAIGGAVAGAGPSPHLVAIMSRTHGARDRVTTPVR